MPNIKNTSRLLTYAGDLECRCLSCHNTMSYINGNTTNTHTRAYRYMYSASVGHQETPILKKGATRVRYFVPCSNRSRPRKEPREVDGMVNSKNEYPSYPSAQ